MIGANLKLVYSEGKVTKPSAFIKEAHHISDDAVSTTQRYINMRPSVIRAAVELV